MLLSYSPPVALLPAFTNHAEMPDSPSLSTERGLGGEVFNGVGSNRVRSKSRGILYVAPDGTATKALPVTPCSDPLEQIKAQGSELAPSCNLREWLLWRVLNMVIGDYIIVPHIQAILSRNGTRTYSILYRNDITTIVGQSHPECLVLIFTWLACVCATENTIEKAQAAYIFQHWSEHFGANLRIPRREEFLSIMLAHEPQPICIQMPGLFIDMPLWELLVPQLRAGQFVLVNELCALLARPSRDTYWLLYDNHLHEFIREKDDEGNWEQTNDELREELIEKVRLLVKLQERVSA